MGCDARRCRNADDLQALFAQRDAQGRPAWLLVATDDDEALALLESSWNRIGFGGRIGLGGSCRSWPRNAR